MAMSPALSLSAIVKPSPVGPTIACRVGSRSPTCDEVGWKQSIASIASGIALDRERLVDHYALAVVVGTDPDPIAWLRRVHGRLDRRELRTGALHAVAINDKGGTGWLNGRGRRGHEPRSDQHKTPHKDVAGLPLLDPISHHSLLLLSSFPSPCGVSHQYQ